MTGSLVEGHLQKSVVVFPLPLTEFTSTSQGSARFFLKLLSRLLTLIESTVLVHVGDVFLRHFGIYTTALIREFS